MSCPENELIKFPFHKSAHNPKAHFKWAHSVTSWIINSWYIVILFYHKRIGTRQQYFYRKMLLELRENIYHQYQRHQAANICLMSIQKLIQPTFTNVTLWWFSDTRITLVTKWLWHHSGTNSNSNPNSKWLTCCNKQLKNIIPKENILECSLKYL